MVTEDEPPAISEDCERCGHPMPEGCIGWCADCSAHSTSERDLVASGGLIGDCICWATDFSGKSVCGVPCPAHWRSK